MLNVPPVAAAVAGSRHMAAAWLSGAGVLGASANDVLVVLSELVTNGVVHDGGDDIVVSASTTPGCVHLEVVTTPRPPGAAQYERPDADFGGTGRGMGIVAELCQDVTIHTEPSGQRTVTCAINIRG